jgi:deoxyribose-phosphate aldolase
LSAITPIDRSELEFDYGSFDAIGFARSALASSQSLAAVMDSALLGPDATRDRVEKLCDEAVHNQFASVLVQPMWTSTAVAILAGTGVQVAVAIGFPFGSSLTSTMRHEAASVMRMGARELEMVIPIGQLKSGNHHGVQRTVSTVAQVAHHHNAKLKVIVETPSLNVQEKLRVAEVAIRSGADFIKTATGFAASGSSPADVALLRGVAGARCGVCGSGGVRTLTDAKGMLEAGANRICTSAAGSILQELSAE